MNDSAADIALTPELLLAAYAAGIFPMAESRQATTLGWYDPPLRGVLPLTRFHVPRRLAQLLRQHPFEVTFDQDFTGVIAGCAGDTAAGRGEKRQTWINDDIIRVFCELHRQGHAHSVEIWARPHAQEPRQLLGGVYGLALNGAFFGESMFSRVPNASKVALVFLAARLWAQGYSLFDAQFSNPHLTQFGLIEISWADYHARLARAMAQTEVRFSKAYSPPSNEPGNSCNVGTAAEPPDTGLTGAICSGAGAGTAAAAVGAGADAAGASAGFSSTAAAATSGVTSGVFSAEYVSASATVASFLQAMTQTS